MAALSLLESPPPPIDCEVYVGREGRGASAFFPICSFGSRLNTSALIQTALAARRPSAKASSQ